MIPESRYRLTLRWKMTLGILLSFILLLPVVTLSLYFLREILREERQITELFAVRQADARKVLEKLDEIDRAEGSYLITLSKGDRVHLGTLVHSLEQTPLRDARSGMELYQTSMESLFTIIEVEKNVDPYRDVERKVERFQQELGRLIDRANRQKDPASRQRYYLEVQEFLRSFEDTVRQMETEGDPQKTNLIRRMKNARGEILRIAQSVERKSTAEIAAGRSRIAAMSNQARKYILSMILVTLLLGFAWILILPKRIAISIHRITNLLRRTELGSLDIPPAPEGSDELGELGRQLNRFVEEIRVFDRLKTEKIQEGENRMRALTGCIDALVFFVNDSFQVIFANDRLLSTFGLNRDRTRKEAFKALSANRELQGLVKDLSEGGKETQGKQVTLATGDGDTADFRVASGKVRNSRGEVRQILVALKPVPAKLS